MREKITITKLVFFSCCKLFFPSIVFMYPVLLTHSEHKFHKMKKEFKVKPLLTDEYNFFSFDILYKIS